MMQKETKKVCVICQYRDLLTRVLTVVVLALDGQSTVWNLSSSNAPVNSLTNICLLA